MKMNLKLRSLIILLLALIVVSSCDSNNDISSNTLKVNNFIKENMETYYLWNLEMPNLKPSKQKDSEAYFYNLIYADIDKWSYITDDATSLYAYFDGIRKEMGYSLMFYLAYENNDNDVVALVEYVEPGSPADIAGLKRGDMIVKYNDEYLTRDNINDFYYAEEAKIGLGVYVDGLIEDVSPSISLAAAELQINPILVNKVFENNGNKDGYLAYTSFISDFDDELKEVFAYFKSEGITDLILDLRYNGGGAVSTAKLMAGMIGPTSKEDDLFIRTAYNDILTDFLKEEYGADSDYFIDNFESYETDLDLSRLYVLTTSGTASASEMVMYSLMPYMDVIQIGEQSHGKYYASITIEDEDGLNWAIQPLIYRAENKNNSIDYSQGLIPDYEVIDRDYDHQLGDENEALTATALDLIWGTSMVQESLKSIKIPALLNTSSIKVKRNPLKYEMYIDREL